MSLIRSYVDESVEQLGLALEKLTIVDDWEESFSASMKKGKITLETSKACALFAVHLLAKAQRSNHVGEYLGTFKPKFPLRALKVPLANPLIAKKCLSWGYNALIAAEVDERDCLEELGVKVFGPGAYHTYLPRRHLPDTLTQTERLLMDIQSLQTGPLILHIDSQQPELFLSLLEFVGSQTIIAFDAEMMGRAHPLWGALRQSLRVSVTPLMPYIQSPKDIVWQERCYRHTFQGFIIDGTLIQEDASYLAAGIAQWTSIPAPLLLETVYS